MLEEQAAAFVSAMEARGVSNDVAVEAAEAGYVLWPIASGWGETPRPMTMDCHYGLKASGLFELDEFAAYLARVRRPDPAPSGVAIYKGVRDLQELREISGMPRHRRDIERGYTCFRGQTSDYRSRRTVPNPRICDEEGKERTIIPSYWRSFLSRPLSERDWGPRGSIFSTMLADPLIYRGIPDWQTLGDRNAKRYGFHSISDLEDFPDPESQEYYRRWHRHKIEAGSEYPLIEQHYGRDTIGLDVTFDLATAAFFAAHQCSQLPGSSKRTYRPAPSGQHTGVIYFLRFRDPSVRRTDHLVTQLGVFEHISPLRPVRQQCALPAFHANEIAAAARDLDAIVYLDASFSTAGLPEPRYLFPMEEDSFYAALLEQKARDAEFWEWVVEYDF